MISKEISGVDLAREFYMSRFSRTTKLVVQLYYSLYCRLRFAELGEVRKHFLEFCTEKYYVVTFYKYKVSASDRDTRRTILSVVYIYL